MIQGIVTSNREAVLRLTIQNSENQRQEIEAVIDTGFNDYLTLSPEVVSSLNLPFAASTLATLADGREIEMSYHRASILWGDRTRNILILSCEGGALIGMSLLYGCELHLHIVDGGIVTIETPN